MHSFSVIIPAYQAEKTIERAVRTLFVNDSIKEIVIVNDGSTDGTENICKKLSEEDKRIIYLYQDNAGPGKAREAGIEISSGDYIAFCDADDFFKDKAMDAALDIMSGSEDIFEFGIEQFDTDGNFIKRTKYYEEDCYGRECLRHFILHYNSGNELCSKFFKRNIISGIKHTGLFMAEDMLVSMQAFAKAEYTRTTDKHFYNVIRTPGSRFRRSFTESKLDDLTAYKMAVDFCREKDPSLVEPAMVNLCDHAVYAYQDYKNTAEEAMPSAEKKIMDTFFETEEICGLDTVLRYSNDYTKPLVKEYYEQHIDEYRKSK